MPTYLEITTPQGRSRVPLGTQPLTIGRHADNKLVIGDVMASRFHCVVERSAGGWVVRDLKSSNGTLMNGKPITAAPLRLGQSFLIGNTQIALVDPAVKPVEDDIVELGEEDEIREEVIETLTEDDVVEVVDERPRDDDDGVIRVETSDEPAAPTRAPNRAVAKAPPPAPQRQAPRQAMRDPYDSGVIAVDASDANVTEPAGYGNDAAASEFERTLEALADSLPEKPFAGNAIALISARGQIMHPALAEPKKKRDAVDIFRLVLVICARSRATDIHMEPKADAYQLRIRIDGLMVDVTRLPLDTGIRIAALVKVLSDIDISQRTIVQEGHFAAKLPGAQGGDSGGFRRADYRVSFAPAVFGQKLVVRIFDAANAPLKVNDLQLPQWMLEAVRRELQKEAGMLLVCGPTGSGKTTTLYALVRSSDTARRNVVTIEDPVEVQIEGATQIQVDESQNKTFSALLRSVLRQDPDAILVGEIRDPETARIAMQAAITGHLVFSTVHTTNSIGSIFRLLDLGVEPYLVAQGLHLVLAQRLVRQLCQFCRKPVKATAEDLEKMSDAGQGVTQVFVPRGCSRCLGTGFAGRRAFFELLSVTDQLRDVIVTSRTLEDIKKAIAETKFVRLEQSGYHLVAEGLAPMQEIDMAVGK